MFEVRKAPKIPKKQETILKLLLKNPFQQKDLASELGISGAGLLYHLNKMQKEHLIQKKEIFSFGSVTQNEIKIDPKSMQKIRRILNIPSKGTVLISGMGMDNPRNDYFPSKIPFLTKSLLEKEGISIDEIHAFITPESDRENALKHCEIAQFHEFQYSSYRKADSPFIFQHGMIFEEILKEKDIILDLTPLSKLLTLKFIEFGIIHGIPCVYLGENEDKSNHLMWIYKPLIP